MTNHQYIQNRMRMSWGLLALGVLLFAAGLALQFLFEVPFNARIISGLGIFFTGLGLAVMLRYRAVSGNSQAAARLINEERDERNRQMRTQAGNRAFWVSLVMSYIALMWLSFASSGSLPYPSSDSLWFYLAAAVVVPFLVYLTSTIYDQKNS